MKEYTPEELRLLTEILPEVGEELRSAMTNIYIAFNAIAPEKERDRDPKLDRSASWFLQSYLKMYRVISNLSDAPRLAEGGTLRLVNGDIAALARELCVNCEGLFAMRNVTLELDSDKSSHIILMDERQIERLLLNLLSNALKFTPAGGRVTLRLRFSRDWVRLSVADTGCGIPPERKERVFERFLDTGKQEPEPHGIGLGLALCQRIAQDHGGLIMVESQVGEGSTFTVSLPNTRSDSVQLRDAVEDPGGFNKYLVGLADALPAEAFTVKYLD